MSKELMLVDHPELPDSVVAGMLMLPESGEGKSRQEVRQFEREAGRSLVHTLAAEVLGPGKVEISGGGNEKTSGSFNGVPLNVSISHTNGAVAVAISLVCTVGIDLEPSDRTVSVKLSKRINHPNESVVTQQIPLIQLWNYQRSCIEMEWDRVANIHE